METKQVQTQQNGQVVEVGSLPDKQMKCQCHNGGKVLHYFQRYGKSGPIWVCSCCGQEKYK